jgi:hypothetical protein
LVAVRPEAGAARAVGGEGRKGGRKGGQRQGRSDGNVWRRSDFGQGHPGGGVLVEVWLAGAREICPTSGWANPILQLLARSPLDAREQITESGDEIRSWSAVDSGCAARIRQSPSPLPLTSSLPCLLWLVISRSKITGPETAVSASTMLVLRATRLPPEPFKGWSSHPAGTHAVPGLKIPTRPLLLGERDGCLPAVEGGSIKQQPGDGLVRD